MQIQPNRTTSPTAVPAARRAAPAAASKASGPMDAKATPAAAATDAAMPASMTDTARMDGLARFDGFRESLMQRVQGAAIDTPSESGAVREAAAWIDHGMDRLRNGFANGTLDSADIERGLGNLFSGATEIMTNARAPQAPPPNGMSTEEAPMPSDEMAMKPLPDAEVTMAAVSTENAGPMAAPGEMPEPGLSDMGASVRDRMMGFAEHVSSRIEGANYPDDQRRATADATNALFESAVARLDAAVFNPQTGSPIDRNGLTQLFSATFNALQGQISSLLGESQKGATLYGADSSTDSTRTATSSLDVAG